MDNKDKIEILNRITQNNLETIFKMELKGTKDGYSGLCPFHKEKTPSFHITRKDGTYLYHCFGCNEKGDLIKGYAKMTGRNDQDKTDFKNIMGELAAMTGYNSQDNKPIKKANIKPDFEKFHNELLNNPAALKYLKGRGIKDLDLFGYDKGNETYKILYQTDTGESIIDHKPGTDIKYKFAYGINKDYPFNFINIKDQDKIYLTEGIFDALCIYQNNGIPAAAVMGHDILDRTVDFLKDKEIIIAFDNDTTGKDGRDKAIKKLSDNGYKGSIKYIDYDSIGFTYKDINEAFQDGADDQIKAFLSDKALKAPILTGTTSNKTYYQFIIDKQEKERDRTAQYLGYELTTFKELCKNTDGIQAGLYVLAAASNVGKTAVFVNLLWDLLQTGFKNFTDGQEKLLSGLFVSLDDNRNIITNRFISHLSGIKINDIQRKIPDKETADKRETAYKQLMELVKGDLLNVLDTDNIPDIVTLEKEIDKAYKTNSEQGRGLIVFIDGLQNLNMGESEDIRGMNIERANRIKALSNKHNIPIFTTVEVLKKAQDERPTLKDIMETGKFAYNASIVWMLSEDKERPTTDPERVNLILDYGKNKLSFYKGKQSLLFDKSISKISEIPNHGDALETDNTPKEGKKGSKKDGLAERINK